MQWVVHATERSNRNNWLTIFVFVVPIIYGQLNFSPVHILVLRPERANIRMMQSGNLRGSQQIVVCLPWNENDDGGGEKDHQKIVSQLAVKQLMPAILK